MVLCSGAVNLPGKIRVRVGWCPMVSIEWIFLEFRLVLFHKSCDLEDKSNAAVLRCRLRGGASRGIPVVLRLWSSKGLQGFPETMFGDMCAPGVLERMAQRMLACMSSLPVARDALGVEQRYGCSCSAHGTSSERSSCHTSWRRMQAAVHSRVTLRSGVLHVRLDGGGMTGLLQVR